MQEDEYLGITDRYNALYKQSGSKFYAFLLPVRNEEESDLRLREIKEKYPDASHICYAVILGIQRDFQKFSDAGEPPNSAGRPILHALLSSGMSFVMAIVVRYFGGKQLGIPGLIEAYGNSAKMCIEQARITSLKLEDIISCRLAPEQAYRVFKLLNAQAGIRYSHTADQFKITCAKSMTSGLLASLKKIPTLLVE